MIFEVQTEAEWPGWEQNHRDYIISYAKVADSLNVELYWHGVSAGRTATA